MNISIDARGINLYNGTGIGTYTENLVKELLDIDKKNNYLLFWTGKNYENYKRDNCKIVFTSKKHGVFYENYYFPNFLKNNDIDIHHIPQNGIGFSDTYVTNCIVTIHDLIPYVLPETTGRGYLEKFLRLMPSIIDKSKGILTVSEYSKKDILKFFNHIPEDKVFVTPLAANSNFKPLDKASCKNFIREKYNFNKPYILYIGGFSSRKNAKDLILSFDKISKDLKEPHVLLLAGSIKDEGKKLVELTKDLSSKDNIIFTGFVEDDLLPTLYNGAEAFIYPSIYEGFGLPPLEAMSCKTPVITSNITSIPEVTGDAAILINPFNKFELEEALINLLNNDSLKLDLANKGYERSLQFSWKNTAMKTLEAYEKFYKS
ncbi:glycosyltransferase family 4 protein [Clostridium sp. Sa3CUN1]|uniref:Glycosyltransferase family 4 protein n=1 Tax=Clostridium gallinarum TaxID=2762246 RepID=A0ABR8Q425_9CLOT|nr:glycosyltransferase family 1 protein [Clostridium gallinarum]MBD7915158.1 glycosyltransferase family 4 protein [Clostridium gallinarum]